MASVNEAVLLQCSQLAIMIALQNHEKKNGPRPVVYLDIHDLDAHLPKPPGPTHKTSRNGRHVNYLTTIATIPHAIEGWFIERDLSVRKLRIKCSRLRSGDASPRAA